MDRNRNLGGALAGMTIAVAALCSVLWIDNAGAATRYQAVDGWVSGEPTVKQSPFAQGGSRFSVRALNHDQSELTVRSPQRERGAATVKVVRCEPGPGAVRLPDKVSNLPWITTIIRLAGL